MHRRRFIAATGASLAGLSGCLGGGDDGQQEGGDGSTATETETTRATTIGANASLPGPKYGDELPSDPDPADGYPPSFETTPPEPAVDPSSFETIDVQGESVALAPIQVVYAWYGNGMARFVDARSTAQYDESHVFGAVSSPVETALDDGPVADWPTGDRIVAYCGCPHHLSSMRAATLQAAGYESVFVIDEGFWEWHDRRYPMSGSQVFDAPSLATVAGIASPAAAGEYALARHPPSGQLEAARIGRDGRFELELRFADVTASSPIVVETPDYEVRAPLGELSAGVVGADFDVRHG